MASQLSGVSAEGGRAIDLERDVLSLKSRRDGGWRGNRSSTTSKG
jgi:hypothetical protein